MPENVETEFKLRTARPIEVALVDAAVRESAFDCAVAASRRHNDIYLDDARRSLAANGIGLRVRVERSGSIVTCKNRGQREGAKFIRDEYEAPWPSPTTPPSAAELPQPLRDAIEPVLLRRPLVPVLRLDVTRDLRRLAYNDHELCELAVDHVLAHGAGRSVQFTEIELEVVDDLPSCEKLAEFLEQALQVEAASNDKPTHAARLLGLARHNGAPSPDSATSASTALEVTLHRQITDIQRAEIGVRQRNDTEAVHLMRTSVRRLRSVVDAFPSLWPTEEHRWMRAHLRALAAELGRVRDLDVMLEQLPAEIELLPADLQPAAERVLDWLRRTRLGAHDDVGIWLRSPQRLDDAQRFLDLVYEFAPGSEFHDGSIGEAVQTRLTKHAAKLRRRIKDLNDDSPIGLYHAARIAGKRLRYLLSELGPFVPTSTGKLGKRLVKLQQSLGDLCDHDAAVRHLLAWESTIRADCQAEPLVGAALGALAQRRFGAASAARAEALDGARRTRRRLRLDLPS